MWFFLPAAANSAFTEATNGFRESRLRDQPIDHCCTPHRQLSANLFTAEKLRISTPLGHRQQEEVLCCASILTHFDQSTHEFAAHTHTPVIAAIQQRLHTTCLYHCRYPHRGVEAWVSPTKKKHS